jgi:hypothetical protein
VFIAVARSWQKRSGCAGSAFLLRNRFERDQKAGYAVVDYFGEPTDRRGDHRGVASQGLDCHKPERLVDGKDHKPQWRGSAIGW